MLTPWHNPAIWHAINVHLPIVLAILGLPLVCIVAMTRGRSRALRWGVVAFYAGVTLTAWFAVSTGERAMDALPPTISAAASQRLELHEKLAGQIPVFAAVTTVLLLLANIPRRWARQTFTTLALVLSVVTAGWVAVAAHSGGLAVYEHGLGTVALHDALALEHNNPLREQRVAPTTQTTVPASLSVQTDPASPGGAIASGALDSAIAPISFTKQIQPLLQSRCIECHAGEDLKGQFDASTLASIVKGGKKSGPAVVAGKPDESPLIHYLEGGKQPRMPKGGKPLEDAQIALLRAWIAQGAVDDAVGAVAIAPPVVEGEVSEDWDPQVKFAPAEAIAVRRYVRLKSLAPSPKVPATKPTQIAFNAVDNFILAKLPSEEASAKAQATPATTQAVDAELCDDATFARRVYLDLIGVIPTAEEAKRFIDDKDAEKRTRLVDALLARSKDYAAHWTPFWEDALCSNGLHQGGVGTHGNYRQWIFSSFEHNKPYDTMVQELLDPSMPNHPPRYVLNDTHMRTVQSSADTAQVFLGTAIKCASCHSHFTNDEWPQQRAVAFAGFFSNKDMELVRCERSTGQFIQTHFMFDLPAAPTSAPSDPAQRRKRVAQLITDPANPRFARTMVNRLWKRYMGLGLFEPADDYREDTPPSHPELLAWLADDFIRHGYDVKRTVRLILTSRTYQLRYDPSREDHFDIEKTGDPRDFRSPRLRRLTVEQLFDSIAAAMEQRVPERRAYQSDASTTLTRSLGKPAARNEVMTQRPDDTAIVQALELLNGQEWHERIYQGDLVDRLSIEPNVDELLETMYFSTLGRAPTEKEKEAGVRFIKSAPATQPTTRPIELVWFDDTLPLGAKKVGNWRIAGPPEQPVFSGKLSHTEAEPFPGPIQHLFTGVRFAVAPKDILVIHVLLDPEDPPKEFMIQFHDGKTWNHRAAWGSSIIEHKPKVTFGELPRLGEWVRLEIPAEKIGFDKPATITGVSFDQVGGKMYWDKLAAAKGPPIHDPQTIGDMLWALLSGPEFQYVK